VYPGLSGAFESDAADAVDVSRQVAAEAATIRSRVARPNSSPGSAKVWATAEWRNLSDTRHLPHRRRRGGLLDALPQQRFQPQGCLSYASVELNCTFTASTWKSTRSGMFACNWTTPPSSTAVRWPMS
jgi:hypothetical protein